jgi:hypothetical protein
LSFRVCAQEGASRNDDDISARNFEPIARGTTPTANLAR